VIGKDAAIKTFADYLVVQRVSITVQVKVIINSSGVQYAR
jgi:hypothetical protein